MKILITGGAGFIGSHLCEKLLENGHEVTSIDNFSTGRASNLNSFLGHTGFKSVEGSILDTGTLRPLVQDSEYVFHLAAAVGVFNIVKNPLASLLTNIRGTENVLEIAHETNRPVFLTSSSEVYGKNISDSLKETDDRILGSPITLRWSYSEAKAIDEFYAFELHKKSALEVTIARLFNTVGPGQSGVYGMVLPRFVKAALSGQPLRVYGDGSQSRSFCAVSDVVEALDSLMSNSESAGQAYNIGSTNEISIKDLAQKVIDITGSNSKIVFKKHSEVFGENFEEPVRRVPDISKISKAIGWQPKKNLESIILEVAEYIKANEV
jgi:UDP-glucose 4-epimerase